MILVCCMDIVHHVHLIFQFFPKKYIKNIDNCNCDLKDRYEYKIFDCCKARVFQVFGLRHVHSSWDIAFFKIGFQDWYIRFDILIKGINF